MSRAGRPRLAVIATTVVFVVTTVAAALMSAHKSRQTEIILGPPKPYRALGVRASFPEGWRIDGPEKIPNGNVLVATPPRGADGRQVVVFRLGARVPGSLAKRDSLLSVIQTVAPGAQFAKALPQGSSTLGKLESEVYLVGFALSLGDELQAALANVAITPDRQVVGLLVVAEQVTARDKRLLRELSDHLSYESHAGRPRPVDNADPNASPSPEAEDPQPEPLVRSARSSARQAG